MLHDLIIGAHDNMHGQMHPNIIENCAIYSLVGLSSPPPWSQSVGCPWRLELINSFS